MLTVNVASRRFPKSLIVPGAALFAVSVTAFFLLVRVIGLGGYDLSVYLLGGRAYMHGMPVYDQQMHSEWGVGYFTYPPVTLLLFGPMSQLPATTAHLIVLISGIAALVAVIWLIMRMLGYEPSLGLGGVSLGIAGFMLWLQPVQDSLHQGQVNLILMMLVVADLALEGRRRWPTGILIGVAAAVKITPAIFIVYLVLTRRYRAAATATGTWLGLTVLGFAVARTDSVQFWMRGTFADSTRVVQPLTLGDVSNQSLHGVMVRLLGDGVGHVAWYPFALVVLAGGLAIAVTADRASKPVGGLLACAVTGLLISPVSWHEHWVWIVPILIFLADTSRHVHRTHPLIAGALPCVGFVFLLWPQPTGTPGGGVEPASILSPARSLWGEGNHHPVVALAGTAYVTVGLALLIMAGGWAVHRARTAAYSDATLPRQQRRETRMRVPAVDSQNR